MGDVGLGGLAHLFERLFSLLVLAGVFYLIYSKMRDGNVKRSIKDFFGGGGD